MKLKYQCPIVPLPLDQEEKYKIENYILNLSVCSCWLHTELTVWPVNNNLSVLVMFILHSSSLYNVAAVIIFG